MCQFENGFHSRIESYKKIGLNNSEILLKMEYKAIQLGWDTSKDFCFEVARKAHELGNEHPSERALRVAQEIILSLQQKKEGK